MCTEWSDNKALGVDTNICGYCGMHRDDEEHDDVACYEEYLSFLDEISNEYWKNVSIELL